MVIGAAEAFPLLDERHRRTWRRFGIERFLRLKGFSATQVPRAGRSCVGSVAPAKHDRRWARVGVHRQWRGRGGVPDPAGRGDGRRGWLTRIPAFEYRYRVIAPSYASVSTAAGLLDGLAASWTPRGSRPRTCSVRPTAGLWRKVSCVATRIASSQSSGEHPGAAAEDAAAVEGLLALLRLVLSNVCRRSRNEALASLLQRARRAGGGPGVLARLPAEPPRACRRRSCSTCTGSGWT